MENIRDLAPDEHSLIGDIIGESFADDAVNLWAFGSEASMTPFFTKVARKLYLPKGFGHVMADISGGALRCERRLIPHMAARPCG